MDSAMSGNFRGVSWKNYISVILVLYGRDVNSVEQNCDKLWAWLIAIK